MKKLIFLFVSFVGLNYSLIAQAVSDREIIPVSVTLNSILRLNIVSGGEINFVVNTINQYSAGIANADVYDTRFTVASSVDFDVYLQAENTANFFGSDNVANTMPLENVGYTVSESGTGVQTTNWTYPTLVQVLTDAANYIVISTGGAGAGDINKNDFTLNWELATGAVLTAIGGLGAANTLLSQSLPPDRYASNVFLVLEAQ